MKISSENIKSKVSELSKSISSYYKENDVDDLCVVVPMNGGVPFAVDILREITNPGADKIFISYVLDKNQEWIFSGSMPNNKSHILIIEDIYDTGETLSQLISYLEDQYNPLDIKTVVMLDKKIEKRVMLKSNGKVLI